MVIFSYIFKAFTGNLISVKILCKEIIKSPTFISVSRYRHSVFLALPVTLFAATVSRTARLSDRVAVGGGREGGA